MPLRARRIVLSASLLVGQRSKAFYCVPQVLSFLSEGENFASRSFAASTLQVAGQRLQQRKDTGRISMANSMKATMETRLKESLSPTYVQVMNRSGEHGRPEAESHFQVVIVSSMFKGVTRLKRHRRVNSLFQVELDSSKIHALQINPYTPNEWKDMRGNVNPPPPCMGGSKARAKDTLDSATPSVETSDKKTG